MIADKRFDALWALNIEIPSKINWVRDVFEDIHVKDHPHSAALLWTDAEQVKEFSFKELNILCNRYLNFLRKHGLGSQAIIFSQSGILFFQPAGMRGCRGTFKSGDY